MKLFPYQADFVDKVIGKVVKERRVIAQAATGAGKTVIASAIIKRYLDKYPDKKVLFLVHREELLNQMKSTLFSFCGVQAQLIVAGTGAIRPAQVTIGMVESVMNRSERLPAYGLMIVDEAHLANFFKLITCIEYDLLIGFTATPKSSNKKLPLNKYYKDIVTCIQIGELIKMGRLARPITRIPADGVDTKNLKVASNGEYDIQGMGIEFGQSKYIMNTLHSYQKYALGKKTIIFNVNIEHSKSVTQIFKIFGYKVKHLDGETPENERREIIQWFKETPDAILCNINVATLGFDEPSIQCVILNRATKSMTLYLQMSGRGMRKIEGKDDFLIIDLGSNALSYGSADAHRDWYEVFHNPEKPGVGVAPMKICPQCGGLVPMALKICNLPKVININYEPSISKEQSHQLQSNG